MSNELTVRVEMARGGKMPLLVTGSAHSDHYGVPGSPVWTEVEIESIKWPGGGGEVDEKNIADMTQVEEAFLEALESNSPSKRRRSMIPYPRLSL
jgi:hypothetical protein